MSDQPDWKIYRGQGVEHDDVTRLRETLPPWRDFRRRNELRARTYKPTTIGEIEVVNAALYLRRPLLVTGSPGSGKSSLAYAVARAQAWTCAPLAD